MKKQAGCKITLDKQHGIFEGWFVLTAYTIYECGAAEAQGVGWRLFQ
jgi:hypothetical protein